MKLESLRLPKLVDGDPRGENLLQRLIDCSQPLRADSEVGIPIVEFNNLKSDIQSAHRAGRVVRGLETATKALADEAHGLRMVDQRSGVERGGRVSRLLLLSNDGSDGFYRQVETIVQRHSPRVLAIGLDTGSEELGSLLFGEGRNARLLMIKHKEAVAAILLATATPSAD